MKTQLLTALAALTLSTAASAQFYGVVSAGVSRLDVDCTGASNCDKTDTGFKLLGGYKFMPNLAAEVGYFDFGKAKATFQDPVLGPINADIKNTAFGGGVAYHVDLAPNWNAVGRLGLAQVKTKLGASALGSSGSDSDNNTALYAGLGVGYKVAKNVSIDGAWDFSRSKYNKNGVDESGNINVFSVGVTFGF
jgi:OmpA-OmpF porin, OOP family